MGRELSCFLLEKSQSDEVKVNVNVDKVNVYIIGMDIYHPSLLLQQSMQEILVACTSVLMMRALYIRIVIQLSTYKCLYSIIGITADTTK